jgi:hypothetical protein
MRQDLDRRIPGLAGAPVFLSRETRQDSNKRAQQFCICANEYDAILCASIKFNN